MTRVEYDRHVRVATQPDDGTSDIQPQRDWNGNAHKQQGIVGYIGTSTTLATDAFVLSDALHVITGEGGSPDNLVTITSTDALNHDVVQLLAAAGQTITVKHGSGNIQLQGATDKVLSTSVRLLLQYDGTNWNEVGNYLAALTSSLNTFALKQTFSGVVEIDNQIGINIGTFVASELIHGVKDGGDAQILLDAYGTGFYNHFIGRAARGSKASPTTLSANDIITSLTGRAYDGTSFAAAGNPQIRLVAAENQSGSAHGTYISFLTTKKTTTTLSEVFRLNDDGTINITNPAFTFNYVLTPAAITANRILNLPLITGTDTLATLGLAQTFTGTITMSGANIALGANSLTTSNYTILETTAASVTAIGLSRSSGNNQSVLALSPAGTTKSSGLYVFRTSDIATNYELVMLTSDFGTSNEHALYVNKGGTGSFRPLNFYNNRTKLMSLDTAATITTYSNIILGAGGNTFVYINGNNNTLYPSSATGVGAIGWNFQSSAIDFWNTFTSATDSFAWRQLTGVGTQTTLMVLGNTGKITRYANISTAGQGLSTIYGSTLQKSETGADTNVLTYTPPSVAGRYRVTVSISVSAATAATLGWTLAWTDSNSHAQTPANL